ncbi:hypothetical protein GAYE_SCF62G6591 [Galdieria yellowstonensis]|uniref:Uncharacterized protein n=1 Tax=Galdieria yellowstonensis TaxID=3028027 RepID=A0AAV9INB7_9RHOD|nr:hypothetical protein GAYE_SCF62G6591 [Galdieria yellowstonensis]
MSRYWTLEEHERFLEARKIYGTRDTKSIAEYVGTRTVTQVRTHTQKFEKRLELARRTGGPGFRVRSKKSSQRNWRNRCFVDNWRNLHDSCLSSNSSSVTVQKNEEDTQPAEYHADIHSPSSIQQTDMCSNTTAAESDPFELKTDMYDHFWSVASKPGDTWNGVATDTSVRHWNEHGKEFCPYSAQPHELYSNLPFWQSVIAKSSWRLPGDEVALSSCEDERGFRDCLKGTNVFDCDDRLCKDEKVFDVENIESTEDLESALMEYFQRKPGFTGTAF